MTRDRLLDFLLECEFASWWLDNRGDPESHCVSCDAGIGEPHTDWCEWKAAVAWLEQAKKNGEALALVDEDPDSRRE